MEPIWPGEWRTFRENERAALLEGDSLEILSYLQPQSVDLIFADPPYFLSNGGVTCQAGRMVSVNKGEWDRTTNLEAKHRFNRRWLALCKPLLKPGGSLWVSGTLHNIYSLGMALEEEGYKIINNITWQKLNPPPNLACRTFTHSTETLLWAAPLESKVKYYFNYQAMKEANGGKQMKDVWSGTLTPRGEKAAGKHPTQKPLYLLERILQASTRPDDLVLDPFAGSSTTGVAALKLGRRYLGLEREPQYLQLSAKRLFGGLG